MNMNFNQLGAIKQIKDQAARFRMNHPKFPLFLDTVSRDALRENSIVEITVKTPEGKEYCSNIKLNADDLQLINTIKSLRQ